VTLGLKLGFEFRMFETYERTQRETRIETKTRLTLIFDL